MWYERARDWVLLRRWPWLLASHDPAVRLQALGEMECTAREIVPALLIPLLADADEAIAQKAWAILQTYGDRARDALREHLGDAHHPGVREQAAQALGRLGAGDDLIALQAALVSPFKEIRAAGRRAIQRIEKREDEARRGEVARRRTQRRLPRPRLLADPPRVLVAPVGALYPATGFRSAVR